MEWVKARSSRKRNWANKRVTTMAFRNNKTKQNKQTKMLKKKKQTNKKKKKKKVRQNFNS